MGSRWLCIGCVWLCACGLFVDLCVGCVLFVCGVCVAVCDLCGGSVLAMCVVLANVRGMGVAVFVWAVCCQRVGCVWLYV